MSTRLSPPRQLRGLQGHELHRKAFAHPSRFSLCQSQLPAPTLPHAVLSLGGALARQPHPRHRPDAGERVTAEQANVIEDKRFSIEHIGGFDIVLNALDNLKALAAKKNCAEVKQSLRKF